MTRLASGERGPVRGVHVGTDMDLPVRTACWPTAIVAGLRPADTGQTPDGDRDTGTDITTTGRRCDAPAVGIDCPVTVVLVLHAGLDLYVHLFHWTASIHPSIDLVCSSNQYMMLYQQLNYLFTLFVKGVYTLLKVHTHC